MRTVDIDGEPWFVVKDVCDSLGLLPNKSNGSYQIHYSRLDADEQQTALIPKTDGLPTCKTGRYKVVSEAGLYKLISRSNKPSAKAFQRWVNHEVLPSIRKTGSYQLEPNQAMPMPTDMADAMLMYAEELKKHAHTIREKEAYKKQYLRFLVVGKRSIYPYFVPRQTKLD